MPVLQKKYPSGSPVSSTTIKRFIHNRVQKPKNTGQQLQEYFHLIFDILLLLGKITYYNLESLYRKFKPREPVLVKEDLVLVTGAGHGIGREIALQYAALGATVVLWDINEDNNNETAKLIQLNGGTKPYSYTCDVTDRQLVLSTAKRVKEDVGDISILVNNAGIMPAHSLEKHTEQEIKKVFDINLLAHFWTIEAFLPAMIKNNHGHIVALSSIAGLTGLPNLVPYSASKFAVRGLMESLFDELNRNPNNNIKTTTVCPFMTDTGLCKKPYVRFEKVLNLLDPKYVAAEIIRAQRTGVMECTIPKFLLTVNSISRLFPTKANIEIKKFFKSGVHSDL